MSQRLAHRLKTTAAKALFILGFRRVYRAELLVSTLAVIAYAGYAAGAKTAAMVAAALLLAAPAIWQLLETRKGRVIAPHVPLFTVIIAALLSMMSPPLLAVAILDALLVEDFTAFFSVDLVKLRETVRTLLIEPTRRREFAVIILGNLSSAVLAFILSGSSLVFAYPAISYSMVAYSLVTRQVVVEEVRERGSIAEEVARRLPFLFYLFRSVYDRPSVRRLAREAGIIAGYDDMIRRLAGVFALSVYVGLAAAPILSVIAPLAALLPLYVGLVVLVSPYLYLRLKRSSRASKIARNLLLALTYLAATKSAGFSFEQAMEELYRDKELAKLFGLEDEARVFMNIASVWGIRSTEVYLETIPHDYWRDTIRTLKSLEENEGNRAAFQMLVRRLREFTARLLTELKARFETITTNIISVLMLVQAVVPIFLMMSNPQMLPVVLLVTGLLSAVVTVAVFSSATPAMPSEYIHAKPRYRYAALVFAATATGLVALETLLLPDLLRLLLVLNIPVALAVAIWYANLYDMRLNDILVDKFPDLMVHLSNVMSANLYIHQMLRTLIAVARPPAILRREIERLARVAETFVSIAKVKLRGVYFWKFFLFLLRVGERHGTAPRELFRALAEFFLEFKKFVFSVKAFTKSLAFMSILSLLIMTVEVHVAISYLTIMSKTGVAQKATAIGVSVPLPQLTLEDIRSLAAYSYAALLAVAVANGFAVAKTTSARDGRWVLILFLVELLLVWVARVWGFGISFQTPTT